jgi:two-component system, cell cycle sensor histidine kinase and response regulator CckA
VTLPVDPKPRLLAVDDDASMRTLVRHTLEPEGYTVHTAPGAAEAKFLMEELGGQVDLLLSDIAMPGGMGTELAKEIRSSHSGVRILYISRYSRVHGIEIAGDRLLPKPFTPTQLVVAVRDALKENPDTTAK